jgi:hypothetical protein
MESTGGGGEDLVFRYMCSLKGVCHENQGVIKRDAILWYCRHSFIITDTAILFRNKFTSGEQKGKRRAGLYSIYG